MLSTSSLTYNCVYRLRAHHVHSLKKDLQEIAEALVTNQMAGKASNLLAD
jgi:hypothetical protein